VGHRILFVGKNHLPHVGGSEISTHHLVSALVARGHQPAVGTRLSRRSSSGLTDAAAARIVGRSRIHQDERLGYPTYRAVRPLDAVRWSLQAFSPDLIVTTCGDPAFAADILDACSRFPAVLYIRDAGSAIAATARHADIVVANSEYVADAIRQLGVAASYLPSLFPRSDYEVSTTRERVLFVNPNVRKGVDLALHLAERRPDIPFAFSLSWRLGRSNMRRLRSRVRHLGNVEVREATSSPQRLFRDCRLVIVPTQVPEAWCRVVSEAQINGIPSVASRLGGLPESVGPGGILIDPPDSEQAWLDALSTVWDDDARYAELSRLARQYSLRAELAVGSIVRRFEGLAESAIAQHVEGAGVAISP
jgi:glycosyltransferase involved in cell wall biosynthesis